ncbi:MAG: helix-turn-helix domain-containing protein, partial [[Clostridium] nexile]
TNHSVAKIANMIGFSSQSYFSQVFKRETNMTPNECRKLIEKKASTSS